MLLPVVGKKARENEARESDCGVMLDSCLL